MAMIQLVYASRPFGFDEATLSGILFTARANNTRDGITGALVCRSDLYLQMLEGPQDKVEAAYASIEEDDRHLEVRCLTRATIDTRMFGAWAMRSDPAQSWMWTREQVENAAPDTATPEEVIAVFSRLIKETPVPAGA